MESGELQPSDFEQDLNAEMSVLNLQVERDRARDFKEDVKVFVADVVAKLRECDALDKEGGWALFLQNDREMTGSTAVFDYSREVFVNVDASLVETDGNKAFHRPQLRIITNEFYKFETTFYLLSEDISIDEDYDTYYFFDAAPYDQANGRLDFKKSWARRVSIYSGQPIIYGQPLQGTNLRITGTSTITEDVEGRIETVQPFGTYKCLEDQIFNLGVARRIIDEIQGLSPLRYSGEPYDE